MIPVLLIIYLMVFAAFAGHELLDRQEHRYIVAPPVWHELLTAALWPVVVPTAFVYRTWRRLTDPKCVDCGGRLGRERWKDTPKELRICANCRRDEEREDAIGTRIWGTL